MEKKAQGMSLNVVVIAALVVLVLVILSVILLGRMGVFTLDLNKCRGECMQTYCDEGYREIGGNCYSGREVDSSLKCCVKLNV
jgi:hypothetical protein